MAYPYSIPKADYRRPFEDLGKDFDVEFVFADQQITNRQILEKISSMIMSSKFSLFDITTWNANVALELGVAEGAGRDYYLLFNPEHAKNPKSGVPSDLGGLDRIEYKSFTEMQEQLTQLMVQEFGVPGRGTADPLATFRERVPTVVEAKPGMKVAEIAEALGVPVDIAKLAVRPNVADGSLETTGQKKGTRYYIKGKKPRQRRVT